MNLIIEHRENDLNLIAGNWNLPNVHLTFCDPWGNSWQEASGSKTEHGTFGFECGVRLPGEGYSVQAGTSLWHFNHRDGGMTFLRPEEGSPEPEPPKPPEPEPPGPISKDILVQPGILYSSWLEGDTIHNQEGMAEGAIWWFVGQHVPGLELWLPFTEPLTLELLAMMHGELLLRVERYGRAISQWEER